MVSSTSTPREKRGIFSSIRIKGSRKDMPYQNLSFPALKEPFYGKERPTSNEQTEIEALWMVGLLDHSNATNEKNVRFEKMALFESVLGLYHGAAN